MHPTAREFADQALEEYGIEIEVEKFPEGTKTAADAAEAIGCDVAQITKSIVMIADRKPVIVLTSGRNRVNEEKLADELGAENARTANPDEVKEETGWSIGGVPPFCHDKDIEVFVDETLLDFDTVWAAAGTPETVFPISPDELVEYSGAETAEVFD